MRIWNAFAYFFCSRKLYRSLQGLQRNNLTLWVQIWRLDFWANCFRESSYDVIHSSHLFLLSSIAASGVLKFSWTSWSSVIASSSSWLNKFWNEDVLYPRFTSSAFTHTLKREVISRKLSSLQGIVIPPIGWLYPNSSSTWLSKSRNKGWFKKDIGITNLFFLLSPT